MEMGLPRIELTENIINEQFSNYFNEEFIKIDDPILNSYDLSHKYNYYYPPVSSKSFNFLNQNVVRAGFAVSNENRIEGVTLYLEMVDLDCFYTNLVTRYGKPEILSYSKYYLEREGFIISTNQQQFNDADFDSIPEPPVEDYKYMKNLNWYFKNKSEVGFETGMIIRNEDPINISDNQVYKVQVILQKFTVSK